MATNPDVAMEKARRRFLMVWTAVGAILLTGAAVYLINILSVPIGILLWTLVIVFCLRGTVNKLESKGVPRPTGTGIAYLLMFAVLAIVSFLMLSPAFGFGEQFTDLVQSIPGYINDFMGWANGVYARYSDVFQNNTVQAYMNEALSSMGSAASDVATTERHGRGRHRRRRGEHGHSNRLRPGRWRSGSSSSFLRSVARPCDLAGPSPS